MAPADWITLQDYYDTINVNMFGLVDVTTTFLPLVKKEKGRIVNTCKGPSIYVPVMPKREKSSQALSL